MHHPHERHDRVHALAVLPDIEVGLGDEGWREGRVGRDGGNGPLIVVYAIVEARHIDAGDFLQAREQFVAVRRVPRRERAVPGRVGGVVRRAERRNSLPARARAIAAIGPRRPGGSVVPVARRPPVVPGSLPEPYHLDDLVKGPLAVADHERIHELREHLGVEGTVTPGDHEGGIIVAIARERLHPPHVHHVQDVRVVHLVLERKANDVGL